MQVSRRIEKKYTKAGAEILELKIREKIRVFNHACMEAAIKNNLTAMSGKVEQKHRSFARQ